jgi:hypothetical protein
MVLPDHEAAAGGGVMSATPKPAKRGYPMPLGTELEAPLQFWPTLIHSSGLIQLRPQPLRIA